MLNRKSSGGRWRIRPDGPEKVTGGLEYLTDMTMPGMLYGKVLRSPYPHARILSISTERAAALEGVAAVLTHQDVPGLNRYGIARADQPVFCDTRVRYTGDAVAAVAAETEELATRALSLIEVSYEPLPVLSDPEKALDPDAPRLHDEGNQLHRAEYKNGDTEAVFAACAHVVETTYRTPRQMHTYMETEGGLFVPSPDGRLIVCSPTQHGFMDRLQLSRILACPPEQIRVVSSPIGGSFGGKDELNVQPYGALLARAAGRPVKIHHSRTESVRAGLKRHPMIIRMKTGTDATGKITAHMVRLLADTGPYATLGAEVLNFATEHVIGSYSFGAVDVESVSVFTNNGMSGEFRGFGGNQTIFALEGQLDRLASLNGMDPWEFRRLNLPPNPAIGPFGQPIVPTEGAAKVWEALRDSRLWKARKGETAAMEPSRLPWIKTGIGASFVMHGAGLGKGIPDPAGGRLTFRKDGKIEAAFGYEECGQGLLATLEQMMIEQFGFAKEDLALVIGDTDIVPDSGSTTASRATSMMWKSLQQLKGPFTEKLLCEAAAITGMDASEMYTGPGGIYDKQTGMMVVSYADAAKAFPKDAVFETSFAYPVSETDRVGAHYMYSYGAAAVKVEVNQLTGRVRVLEQFHTVAAGPVMNPQGFLGQIEGGSGMALGFALTEEAVMERGEYLTKNLDSYLIPSIVDLSGEVEVLPIEDLPPGDEHGPRGVGEIGSIGLAPAIASALFDAVGVWVDTLPVDPSLLQAAPHIPGKEAKPS